MKAIALVDCNSFYASCERIFRPDLRGRPVIVLSNNDGCAIARTQEAKDLGIKMGAPFFQIRKFCEKNNVAVFSSNFSLYTNISDRVMSLISNNVPKIEVYSVDEAFADLTGIQDLSGHGKYLREIINDYVGIPTGVGIGPTKVLAKVANYTAKKSSKANGVVNLMEERLQDIALKRMPVGELWGVGRRNAEKMKALGIKTAYDLKIFPNEVLIQKIFTKIGVQIKHELMGINCFELGAPIEPKKEIMCSRTFSKCIYDKSSLKEIVSGYIENASAKMRAQGSTCLEVIVFARTNPHKDIDQYYMYENKKLINPTSDSRKLVKAAHKLIDQGYRHGYEYRKAGVRLARFFDAIEYQIDFLHPSDTIKDKELMKIMDRINYKEGEGVIKLASSGTTDQAWRMNRNFKSPRYTTSWGELPTF